MRFNKIVGLYTMIEAILDYLYVMVSLSQVCPSQQIIAEDNNIRPITSIVFTAKIKLLWLIFSDKFGNPLGVCTPKFINSLICISEGDQITVAAQRLNHFPFISVCVLKLIEHDDRICSTNNLC